MSKPRKPAPFRLTGEIVADCFVDGAGLFNNGRVVVVDAVFHLIDAEECRSFIVWLEKAIAWRDAE